MSLFESASLVVTPNGTKAGKLYAIKPTSGAGDLSVTRSTTATRVNSAGLIESVSTNVPRLDYTNSTCPSILVEPQRTNLALRSQEFDNASWIKINSIVTANSIISPDGTQNADKFVENNGTGQKWLFFEPTLTIGASYTYSIYAKKGERDFIYINAFSAGNKRTWFNLNTGTVATSENGTASIQNVGNGWYRCSVTITTIIGTQFYIIGVSNADNIENYTGNGTSGIYVWGAQLEAGSYTTSYIPTTSAIVTRNADVITKSTLSGITTLTTTFEDNTTQVLTNPTSYTMPNGRIKLVIAI